MWEYHHTDELKHYGVKGMKWGVRKNPVKAYAKSKRKQLNLDAKIDKKKSQREEWKSRQKKANADIAELEPRFKARETALQIATNRYNVAKTSYDRHGHRFDPLGVKSRSVRRAELSYEAAAKAYNRVAKPMNKALKETYMADAKIKKLSKDVEKATAKSEKWQRAMKEVFADVPRETIADGEKFFKEHYER
jgi:chromosome segregation ATPase